MITIYARLVRHPNAFCFMLGLLLATTFAPLFLWPAILALAIFAHLLRITATSWNALIRGFLFGLGFFVGGLYWIAIGVSVYINEFWWAIPLALFGIPALLALFIAIAALLSWKFRNSSDYAFYFSVIWVFVEWVRSWIFTGFPWNLMGYSLAFSNEFLQMVSIFGPYGLSFFVVYLATNLLDITGRTRNSCALFILLSLIIAISFGKVRLQDNPTHFSDVKLRIVQPSIPQTDKWDYGMFMQNLRQHTELSLIDTGFKPDLIIWPESAITTLHDSPFIKKALRASIPSYSNAVLITGGIGSNGKKDDDMEIYVSMYGINSNKNIVFEYHKSHLVPFGEYMPLRSVLPFKKLTHGFIDYSPGLSGQMYNVKNLKIYPLICYESIFPAEIDAYESDVIINITNDGWYGDSSGPYQHFHATRVRAIENGVPLIRSANNGISAIIDPLGRVISATSLNHVITLDGILPQKLQHKTMYKTFGDYVVLVLICLMYLKRKVLDKMFFVF